MTAKEGERYRNLREFLKGSFHPDEFEIFLSDNDLADVAKSVNATVAGDTYFFTVIQALDHRGLINVEFFDLLAKERPKKAAQIKGLANLWVREEESSAEPPGRTRSNRPVESVPSEPAAPRDRMPATPTTGERAGVADRLAFVRDLCGLAPADWAMLVAVLPGAATHIGRHGTVPEQAADLIRWAESSTGPGLEAIGKAFIDLETSRRTPPVRGSRRPDLAPGDAPPHPPFGRVLPEVEKGTVSASAEGDDRRRGVKRPRTSPPRRGSG